MVSLTEIERKLAQLEELTGNNNKDNAYDFFQKVENRRELYLPSYTSINVYDYSLQDLLFRLEPIDYLYNVVIEKPLFSDHFLQMNRQLMDTYNDNDCLNKSATAVCPRVGKSSMYTLAFPLFLMLNNPDSNIMLVSATEKLVNNFGLRIRELFLYNKFLLQIAGIRISDKESSRTSFSLERISDNKLLGKIHLTSIGSQISGLDVDYLIIDDLIKNLESITPTNLDKINDAYNIVLMQRLEPESKLFVIGTIWSREDPLGKIIVDENPNYNRLTFKAVSDGKCIFPEKFTVDYFNEKRQQLGNTMYQALYNATPIEDSGGFFNTSMLGTGDVNDFDANSFDQIIATCRSWDFAFTDEKNASKSTDYTADVLCSLTESGKFLIREVNNRRLGDKLLETVRLTAERDGMYVPILLESGTTGGASKFLFDQYKEHLYEFPVMQSKPVHSKTDRATNLKIAVADGDVILTCPESQQDLLIDQMRNFPSKTSTVHDDCVDCLSYAYNYLVQSKNSAAIGMTNINHRYRKPHHLRDKAPSNASEFEAWFNEYRKDRTVPRFTRPYTKERRY